MEGSAMQRDYWYSVAMTLKKLESPERVGQIAAKLGITPRRSPFDRSGPGDQPRQAEHAKPVESAKLPEQPKAAEPSKS